MNFDRNSTKIIQSFAKFWNSPIFKISKVWNPSKTATVILGNPEIFKYPIQCRPWGGGSVDIFWNSPITLNSQNIFHYTHLICVLERLGFHLNRFWSVSTECVQWNCSFFPHSARTNGGSYWVLFNLCSLSLRLSFAGMVIHKLLFNFHLFSAKEPR